MKTATFICLLVLAGCAGGEFVPATGGDAGNDAGQSSGCRSDDDCDPSEFCIDGECQPETLPPGAGADDAGSDAGQSADAGNDAGSDAGEPHDAGSDAGEPHDAGTDAGEPHDAGTDAGEPADAGQHDAGTPDAGTHDAGPAPLGHLTLSPSRATATVASGAQLAAQTFTLGNSGDAQLAYAVSCSQGSATPSSGDLAASAQQGISMASPVWSSAGTETISCSVDAGTAGSATWTLTVTVTSATNAPIGPTGGTVDLLDFVFTGDTRPTSCWSPSLDSKYPYPSAVFQNIVETMGSLSPQFAFDLGDHMYECNENLADATAMMGKYTAAIAAAQFKPFWFMTMGNHECGAGSNSDCSSGSDANTTAYLAALKTLSQQTLPYYKVDIQTRLGLARFVFIADNWYPADAQAWVESTLADADLHAKYTFIIKHHPIAESIGSLRSGPSWSYDLVTSGKHKYTLVLTAHAHDYEHPTADYSGRSLICGLGGANTSYVGFCRVQQQADGSLLVSAYDQYGTPRTDPSASFTVLPQ